MQIICIQSFDNFFLLESEPYGYFSYTKTLNLKHSRF